MVRLPSTGMTLKGLAPRLRLDRSALPVGGGALALLAAGTFFVALPDWRLEQLVEASGLPRLLPLAQPPLGNTARLMLGLVAGLLAGAVTWSALYLVFGPGGMLHRAPESATATVVRPSVRRADAHPDAPPRHPLTAAELGTPPPPSSSPSPAPAERGLPADLDQPLAAFDPAAIPDVPREPVRPVAPIVVPASPVAEPVAEPVVEPLPTPIVDAPPPLPSLVASAPLPRNDDPSPSIAALLDRLERGTRRRR